MTKTIVYIDVDGVINSFSESRKLSGWEGEWKLAKIIGYNIHWYTDLIESIHELDSRDDVEIKWLTTWQDKAVTELCEPLSLNGKHWDVLYSKPHEDLFGRREGWWKLSAIMKDIAIHNPDKVVWIDDDFKYEINAIEWAAHLGDKMHVVSPSMDIGMTKEDFSGILEFISK